MAKSEIMSLKDKYGLVHVPTMKRCRQWATVMRMRLAARLPPERAGLLAAEEVFRYEAREFIDPSLASAETILDRIERVR